MQRLVHFVGYVPTMFSLLLIRLLFSQLLLGRLNPGGQTSFANCLSGPQPPLILPPTMKPRQEKEKGASTAIDRRHTHNKGHKNRDLNLSKVHAVLQMYIISSKRERLKALGTRYFCVRNTHLMDRQITPTRHACAQTRT